MAAGATSIKDSNTALGARVSLACTLHCIALPLLLAFVPATMMALRSFQHPAHGLMTVLLTLSRWEWAFALLASALAVLSTMTGWIQHRHRVPAAHLRNRHALRNARRVAVIAGVSP